jgi:hypothetical protein
LASLTLAVGLWTAVVACYNHQRAANLSGLQRELEILRAANDQAEAEAAAHIWGQAQGAPVLPAQDARGHAEPEVWRP